MIPPLAATLSLATAALALACCTRPATQAPPPPEVVVVQVTPQTVDQPYEFTGSVVAYRRVEVRAQVGGVILERPFREGQTVGPGDTLFRIDPTAFDAEWRAARARLVEAQARLVNAEQHLTRMTALLADNAISRQDFDNAESSAKQARAGVEESQGLVDRARKSLNDAVVRAELGGRVGRAWLEVGARVRGSDDVLTTIDVLDPIYVAFQPSGQQFLAWRRDPRISRLLVPRGPLQVQAILSDGAAAPSLGRIDFIDPVIDPATATQLVRAVFPNRQNLLVPGQFVRVRLLGLKRDSAMVVPQRAVLQQMGRQSVYIVSAGDTVRARGVVASGWTGDQWIIESGLSPNDRVIVDGVQKVGPGLKVRVVLQADSASKGPPR